LGQVIYEDLDYSISGMPEMSYSQFWQSLTARTTEIPEAGKDEFFGINQFYALFNTYIP
jgi:hypothetical protein